MNDIELLTRAYHFAALAHVDQRRKGEAAEPYMNHLTEVAELVAQATNGEAIEIVVAAILHDTIEDTETTVEDLRAAFGPRVADLVMEVTDDKSLPSSERKSLQVEHAAHASAGAQIIKIADKTANLRSLVASPPPNWSKVRRDEYVAWAGRVVEGCRGANRWLAVQFDAAVEALTKPTA